jgi:glycosyltransferase involved in cell wall biosynthesis
MNGSTEPGSIAVVIPSFNEEDNVEKLSHDLLDVLSGMGRQFEIIFVNDGSTDRTLPLLEGLISDHPEIRVIDLEFNAGQTAATLAGFHNATGDIIVSMDSDLQHFPEDIPKIVQAVETGFDCIGSWRYDRKTERFGKRFPSKVSNILAYHLTGTHIHDFGSGFKAYRRECVKDIQLYGSFHRYIPAIIRDRGFTVSEIRIDWRERYGGKTKYGSSRILKGLRDLFFISITTRFKRVPGTQFLAKLMLKVNYDGGRPTYIVRNKINFP